MLGERRGRPQTGTDKQHAYKNTRFHYQPSDNGGISASGEHREE
jgi:hypothetical protein